MATIFRITAFGGIAPRVAARLLPDNMGQMANNLKRTSGEIRPFGALGFVSKPARTMPPATLYQARDGLEAIAWLSWPFDVDVVRAPLSVDVESRFCWTGDGPPKYATFSRATQSGANDYPSHNWTLGVPKPLTQPTVAPSGGTADTVSRLYCYTFFSELGEESAPSPASDIAAGYSDATGVVVTDSIPISTTYVAGSATVGYYETATDLQTIVAWVDEFGYHCADSLTRVGVRFKACRISMRPHGYTDADFPLEVEFVPAGIPEMIRLQMRGYATGAREAPSAHPAQQESCFTSLLKVCAASFNPSTIVR